MMNMDAMYVMTFAIFAVTYLFLALGRVPGLHIDRAGIALAGAGGMLAIGSLSFHEAALSIDMETIVLLTGMMILVAYLTIAGMFESLTEYLSKHFRSPHSLLAAVILVSGVLSALMVNDVVCVAMTPLVFRLCRRLGRHPIPYLIGLSTASNVGSVATITGNPQNIIIGSLSGISYLRFAERLAPIAIVGLILNYIVVAVVYRNLLKEELSPVGSDSSQVRRVHSSMIVKGLIVTLATAIFFVSGFPIATVSLVAAAVLMIDRIRPSKIYQRIDWPLLVMFAGLFIVVHAFDVHVVRQWHLNDWTSSIQYPIVSLSAISLVLSNLVSNVPAVLLLRPMIDAMPNPEQSWLILAMSSTLAGNLTLLGSVANLIVAETARRNGLEITFMEYLKVGIVVTLLTMTAGMAWLFITAH